MDRKERAKQFMPFDALKGLQEELRRREEMHSRVEKKVLSDDQMENISAELNKIQKGSKIIITFYDNGHYVTIEAMVAEINAIYRYIKMGTGKVFFDDIYNIRVIEI